MGNNRPNKAAAKKAQAKQYLPSGEGASVGLGAGGSVPQSALLQIKLVRLVPSILSQVSVNDRVGIIWQDAGYYCIYDSAQLGKIPANYNAQLQPVSFYSARVVKCNHDLAIVIIEVHL